MRAAFPTALVDGYQDLTPVMTNAPKDRHVLAAAVRAGAALIVTANLKDFPAAALDPYDIQAVHPDDFLLNLLDLDTAAVLRAKRGQQAALQRPSLTRSQFHQSLRLTVTTFVEQVERLERG